ncbi:uncharacterized protein LOC105355020 isoform X5 [Oryzias latipes]|uniref:uncharacterized protein LOC105355020 isoform X5 n=1 Tax=Oryzias latipes TaxID=8090 RepID=UPI0009D92370|nr:uncharacterized protein LOC105355020 isoform X5 [Oryzias latipes]
MSISLCCCLIVFALTSHVAADFVYKAVNETRQITLHCQQTIKGDVKWNRETNDDDKKQTNDPRYNSQADRSLLIIDAKFSDSGRYYCNNEAAVELTVIPSGTTIKSVKETETVTLKCPDEDEGSDDSKWSRQFGEIPQQRFQMKKKKLTIKDVKQEDTGLYYCGGKPAVFLNVTSRSEVPLLHWLILVGTLIFLVIITTACFTWRQKCKKQEAGSECHVYDEISHTSGLQPDTDPPYSVIGPSRPSPISGSNQDSVYSLIGLSPRFENNQDSPYSLIGPSSCSGNDGGSSLPGNSTYILLEKPKAPTNPDEQL